MELIIHTKDIDVYRGKNKKKERFLEKIDKKNHFKSRFYIDTGLYKRSGVFDEDGFDTGKDPWMSSMPELIDVGILGHCEHGRSGLCAKSGIECYQNGLGMHQPNMSLENFKRIVDECKGRVFQFALGGRGDVDQHENFEEILQYCKENDIVPNFTTSGLGMTPEIAAICKKYCGAVAVSQYSRLDSVVPELAYRRVSKGENRKIYRSVDDIPVMWTFGNTNPNCHWDETYPGYVINGEHWGWDELHHMVYSDEPQEYEYIRVFNERYYTDTEKKNYTMEALNMIMSAGVKTNIHYVVGNNTIDEALTRLKYGGFPKGINAVIFLLHKPVGLGTDKNVLQVDDPRVKEFYSLLDKPHYPFSIGLDSCNIPGVINMTSNIDAVCYDTCEAARWSMYITSDMKALPCSFDNQELKWAYDISNDTIENAWNSKQFDRFRSHFKYSCIRCKDRANCMGGCPIRREIVLCDRPEKDLV